MPDSTTADIIIVVSEMNFIVALQMIDFCVIELGQLYIWD
jgi:hypothetical protein